LEWLDDTVLQYMETMELTPAFEHGAPIEKTVSLPVSFKLTSAEN